MKKQWNARLSEAAIHAIKLKAQEWVCSEADVIERWAGLSDATTVTLKPADTLQPNFWPSVAPRAQTREERMVIARAALACGAAPSEPAIQPSGPVFPFKVQVGDDVWTIWHRGTRYGYEIEDGKGDGGLTEARALELWEKRIQ